jgi:hypothetical protein
MFRALRELFDWIIDHASWDLAMRGLEKSKWKALVSLIGSGVLSVWEWFSHRTWPEILTVGLVSFAALWGLCELYLYGRKRREEFTRRALPLPDRPSKPLHTISFEYLPSSPLEKGWTRACKPEGEVTFATDPDIPGSLQMRVTSDVFFAMDHQVPLHATLADHCEFTAKYSRGSNETMIFTHLEVASNDGSERKRVWFKYYHGNRPAGRTWPSVPFDPAKQLPEQTVWLPAKILDRGRMEFYVDFPETVRAALGNQGWVYKSVWTIRLRGDLSISPLLLGSFTQLSEGSTKKTA